MTSKTESISKYVVKPFDDLIFPIMTYVTMLVLLQGHGWVFWLVALLACPYILLKAIVFFDKLNRMDD